MATKKKTTKRRGRKRQVRRVRRKRGEGVDLSKLGFDQLQALVRQADERAQALRADKMSELREKWRQEADKYGFSLEEVVGTRRRRRKKKAAAKKARRKASGNGRRRKARAKYRHPSDPEKTWAGRGRRPKWLEAHLAAGGTLEELAT